MGEQVERWIAILSPAFPVAAFLWEFAIIGRKRLGHRVQMDTLAADAAGKPYAGVLSDVKHDDHELKDPPCPALSRAAATSSTSTATACAPKRRTPASAGRSDRPDPSCPALTSSSGVSNAPTPEGTSWGSRATRSSTSI